MKKVYRVFKFNEKAWLKPYLDMNTKLRQKEKNLRTTFSSWWIMWENIKILNLQQQKGEKII